MKEDAGEMTWLIKSLLCKQERSHLDPQHVLKIQTNRKQPLNGSMHLHPSARQAERGRSWDLPPASLRGSVRFRFSEKKMKNAGVIHAFAYTRHEHTHLHIQTRGVRLWGWAGHLEPLIIFFPLLISAIAVRGIFQVHVYP